MRRSRSPRCWERSRTRSTSPRGSRPATPSARPRSACGSAEQLGLGEEERSALFYALLLKDAGCSSNASRLSSLFAADDHADQARHEGHRLVASRVARASTRGGRWHPARAAGQGAADARDHAGGRGHARADRHALRARGRDRPHARAAGGDRAGDPRPRRALGRRRPAARAARRGDPAVRAHPLPGADGRGVRPHGRAARRARHGAQAPRPLVRSRAGRRPALGPRRPRVLGPARGRADACRRWPRGSPPTAC